MPASSMTVLPLYWIIWHDLPTSLPPPSARNISSSDGSTGSSSSNFAFMAECGRLAAMAMAVVVVMVVCAQCAAECWEV